MLTQWKDNKRGVSIIEILIVIAIIVIALSSLLGISTFSLKISTLIKETGQANNLAQEAMEAVRNFRDGTDWNVDGLGTLATTTVFYHPEKSTDILPKWQMISGAEIIDGFLRKIVFDDVFRDENDNIVDSGGTIDPNTKKITVTVSWKEREVKIVTYLTNWR